MYKAEPQPEGTQLANVGKTGGVWDKVFYQAVGVAIPSTIREM